MFCLVVSNTEEHLNIKYGNDGEPSTDFLTLAEFPAGASVWFELISLAPVAHRGAYRGSVLSYNI